MVFSIEERERDFAQTARSTAWELIPFCRCDD